MVGTEASAPLAAPCDYSPADSAPPATSPSPPDELLSTSSSDMTALSGFALRWASLAGRLLAVARGREIAASHGLPS